MAAALLGLMLGCATQHPQAYTSPVPESLRRQRKAVLVVARPSTAALAPVLQGTVGRGKGAGKGASTGAGAGALVGLQMSLASGPFAPALAPILVPVGALLGATGGTAIGAATAIPAKAGQATRELLARSQRDLTVELARRVQDRLPVLGRAVPAPDAAEVPLRLEVSVDQWGLDGAGGAGSMARFFFRASYGVQGVDTGSEPASHQIDLGGARRLLSEWSAEDGALLRKALEEALAASAEAVTDGVFLIHDFHEFKDQWGPSVCGLTPREPGAMGTPYHPLMAFMPKVSSLTPILRWEPFPRKTDVDADEKGILRGVSRVRYDLRIWASNPDGDPGGLVYERLGLVLEPATAHDSNKGALEATDGEGGSAPALPGESFVSHRLEVPLTAGTTYLWSVRGRFLLAGEERVTRWAYNRLPYVGGLSTGRKVLVGLTSSPPPRLSCLLDGIPWGHHHRFQTP